MDQEVPDLYTDSIQIAGAPFGFTLTLLLSDPATASPENPGRVVGRVRMSPELAAVLGDILQQAAADYRKKAQAQARKV